MTKTITRCPWANKNSLEQTYHDKEWGIPMYDDKQLFKQLILEGKQAGLSWSIILKKRDRLSLAFDDFDPDILITYDDRKINELLHNDDIIKNKLKIKAVISNAFAYLKLQRELGSFAHYLWSFVNHQPIVNSWETIDQVPSNTPLSDKISNDLKKRGFKFVGSTTIYAFMQAVGMVNDHLVSCDFRHTTKSKHPS